METRMPGILEAFLWPAAQYCLRRTRLLYYGVEKVWTLGNIN